MDKPLYASGRFLIAGGISLMLITAGLFLFDLGIIAPPQFQGEKTVIILKGASAQEISLLLKQEGVIRRPSDFLMYLTLTGNDTYIKPGLYMFAQPTSVPRIVRIITSSAASREVTFVEGWSNAEMAEYLQRENIMPKKDFLQVAAGQEGFLFPDTYRIFEHISPGELVQTMRDTFDSKTVEFNLEAQKQKRPFGDFVTMASLIEKEATNGDDRAIVSGILWERLAAGLPLQVDATITYITGRANRNISKNDFQIDSPYNTYLYAGLPTGPIGNPGYDAIHAAFFPKSSPYLFYLHDTGGQPHYAKTFEEHKANIAKYLR